MRTQVLAFFSLLLTLSFSTKAQNMYVGGIAGKEAFVVKSEEIEDLHFTGIFKYGLELGYDYKFMTFNIEMGRRFNLIGYNSTEVTLKGENGKQYKLVQTDLKMDYFKGSVGFIYQKFVLRPYITGALRISIVEQNLQGSYTKSGGDSGIVDFVDERQQVGGELEIGFRPFITKDKRIALKLSGFMGWQSHYSLDHSDFSKGKNYGGEIGLYLNFR